MSLEVGAIVEGEVTGITNFGAFVQLPEPRQCSEPGACRS